MTMLTSDLSNLIIDTNNPRHTLNCSPVTTNPKRFTGWWRFSIITICVISLIHQHRSSTIWHTVPFHLFNVIEGTQFSFCVGMIWNTVGKFVNFSSTWNRFKPKKSMNNGRLTILKRSKVRCSKMAEMAFFKK